MTEEKVQEMLGKIDRAVGPPSAETAEDRTKRLAAAARRREIRRGCTPKKGTGATL